MAKSKGKSFDEGRDRHREEGRPEWQSGRSAQGQGNQDRDDQSRIYGAGEASQREGRGWDQPSGVGGAYDAGYGEGYGQGGLGERGMGQRSDFGPGYGFGGGRQGGFGGAYGAGGPGHGQGSGLGERGMGERGRGGGSDWRGGPDWGRQGRGREDRGGPYGSDRGFMERAGDEVSSWFGDDDARRRREEDHRGKGPRGYRRSDDRIREDVNDHLSEDSRVDASDIEVMVENGEVTLSGEVTSRQAKRQAEDCVERVSGVGHVQNNLRVRSASSGQSGMTGGGSMGGSGRATGSETQI
jgi:hypothetical protein